jgi:hypothetical protein
MSCARGSVGFEASEIVARCLSDQGGGNENAGLAKPRRLPSDHTFRSCLNYTRIVLHTQAQNAGNIAESAKLNRNKPLTGTRQGPPAAAG